MIKARLTFLDAKEAVLKKAINTAVPSAVLLLGMPAQHLDQSALKAAWRWPGSAAT